MDAKRAFPAVRYISIVNFFIAVLVSIYMGGDALNGRIENGRYFLNWHGHLTEVSEGVFLYSRWHFIATFILIGLGAISVVLSKPTPREQKWTGRTILVLLAITAAYDVLARL